MISLNEDRKAKISQILKNYGDKAEKGKAIEEMSELSDEIFKDLLGELDRDHLVEELADVLITLQHLVNIYNISEEEILEKIDYKLNRQFNRMEEENNVN